MIILRVAMGRGMLKESVKEINTTLVFARPATVTIDEKFREVRMAIDEIEASTCGPGTPTASSGTSVNEYIDTVGDAC
jgi:hypothetical protein